MGRFPLALPPGGVPDPPVTVFSAAVFSLGVGQVMLKDTGAGVCSTIKQGMGCCRDDAFKETGGYTTGSKRDVCFVERSWGVVVVAVGLSVAGAPHLVNSRHI